ncbi:MAG: Asp-tRNA(Asn)/Glu-tRNA(Gln) amidotransferase subunit GatB [Actinomycetota bacterium]|jgi:aspartyl-tRNA(Asn)/glutamyl-tRNA(Gln) amidotransferase subunit B|nr:Asp-tRNA(Asn)/Glu-tRNA(Gln) amidotransferase subunit GatB [Actinomycetota bacterium]MDD5600498.1 Asp-tRNA(Asn)/Glu-tRNA(Gln) amidotransferase subunit GatB [Actinomycetota bacterium]
MERENKYEAVIGLETHVELSTVTKMFCGCRLSFGEEKNKFTCPVCLGHPGSLPVTNWKAVEYAIKIALALNCKINKYTIFHRKNYFYPDMAKNYQISQYDMPLSSSGYLDVDMGDYTRRVGITRVHMEEDTGKLIHTGVTGRISESEATIVDYNRSGTPLIEIVTEPDIRSPEEAREYLIALRNLILFLDVSDCSMEEGSLRCDANVSIRERNSSKIGTKTEIKNLNSFKFLQKGLEYEIKRQIKVVESGDRVIQQTRHYDSRTGTTKAMRSKEEAQDYRYFPEPDLVPICLKDETIEGIRKTIPELPLAKARRLEEKYGLPAEDSRFLANNREIADYFEECCRYYDKPKNIANWIMGDFSALLNKERITIKESRITPGDMCKMLEMVDKGKISSRMAKSVFEEMFTTGKGPEKIIAERGLEQVSDESILESIIDEVIKENPGPVEQFREGKEKAMSFLIGQVMAKTKGKANPQLANEIMRKKID